MPDRYEDLGLAYNPFPEPGSVEAIESVSVTDPLQALDELNQALRRFNVNVRKNEIAWLEHNVLDKLKNGEKCPNVWVSGPKGVGKSILLKYVVVKLQDTNILPVYIKYSREGFARDLGTCNSVGWQRKIAQDGTRNVQGLPCRKADPH